MRTLVEDEFEPRPQFKPTINTSSNTTGSATSVNVVFAFTSMIRDTPLLADRPREPFRTTAFVDRRPEIEVSHDDGDTCKGVQ